MTASLGKVLIVGTGPAAFQTAKIIKNQCEQLGLVNRSSERWKAMFESLHNESIAHVIAAKPSLEPLAGQVIFDAIFEDLRAVGGEWDTLVIVTPSHAYADVLVALPKSCLSTIKIVVLISSLFGGHQLVKGFFAELSLAPNVLVFSNYFAATKFITGQAGIRVITKAVKKRIYAYSSQAECAVLNLLAQTLADVSVAVVELENGFSVEGRNITSFVHPAFFITPFSLNHILSETREVKYMYKLFPEGPITTETIHTLVELWRDISRLLLHFNGTPFNLLQFLNDDNYPVHPETIHRSQIKKFMSLTPIEQEYLVYVRYSAILIDPFSKPDTNGCYFDFSAVPYTKGKVEEGELYLPRIPREDIQTLYWLQVLGIEHGIALPSINRVLAMFESWLRESQLPNLLIEECHTQAQKYLKWVRRANEL
ncbi:opine metallophore biosynthesis dehydrogenase [Vibrio sp. L5-1]|uniref:Opine metallophore biosynthesis dehydrogenase n=3 Tax=Vibrio TaxID=662 RepID=A0A9X3CTH3_9VIBR|nr:MULTISPECIES: opine metallophore biosynthesis dehydrogenase [Vibrio]MCF7498026.1 opine metallophore biosynthesis dehydrogenase [Vibrio sp. L5-1]MCW8348210.1 opine metallophore biosynthesis dehydrogenase [Vibrio qingdaonensis]